MGAMPLYFEGSWAILSTIGINNVIFGFIVVGVTGFSPIALVPIVVSMAGAVANGLCFYALYANYSKTPTVVAAIFADLLWLVQEAGLSFYSYMILRRVLKARARIVFLSLFWFIIALISGLRMAILVCRAQDTIDGDDSLQKFISRLHIGYFVFIAVVEIVSAFFLIRIFNAARKQSVAIVGRAGLFSYLTQSTELRLATLALIGITRAITYSFQKTTKASDVTGQLDRFVYTLECMFPMIMYIDILASRIASSTQAHPSSSRGQANSHKYLERSRTDKDIQLYSIHHSKSVVVTSDEASSSQERIVQVPGDDDMGTKSVAGTVEYERDESSDRTKKGTISKTVEFGFHDSAIDRC
ncbi:hypothetical protein BKA66DRAFT_568102 [Pyrenochaeta sp. MPI-SDFR-AT-0127]|nr:hypothetical protein BKA66DRAFT_568102 [Pyrenochaeta sp. MPI-SDFR-AT-0127]